MLNFQPYSIYGDRTALAWLASVEGHSRSHEITFRRRSSTTNEFSLSVSTLHYERTCKESDQSCSRSAGDSRRKSCATRDECLATKADEGTQDVSVASFSAETTITEESPSSDILGQLFNAMRDIFLSNAHTPADQYPELKEVFDQEWAIKS
jgi:hypothetical protein